ncbi:MAG: ATP-dependent DNA ligase [Candidatus Woesearchaeota archaeon]
MDYSELADHYEKIENTSKRLEKTALIADILKKTSKDDKKRIVLLLQGRVFPEWDERKIGIASRLVIKALNKSTGSSSQEIEKEWKDTGDLGETAENLVSKKKQSTLFSSKLTVKKVFENIKNLALMEGKGSIDQKMHLISELLTSAKPKEAKYIVRTLLEELRVGASKGTLRDSIIKAFFEDVYENRDSDDTKKEEFKKITASVQRAYDLTNDFSEVVDIVEESGISGLDSVSLKVNKPVNPMLFPKAVDIEDGFRIVGKPAIIEYKYDGFRVQIHKDEDNVELYTRRLENVTNQFPDVVESIKKQVKAKKCILDSEVLGINYETGDKLPFQNISQRIRRKYNIEDMVKRIPVVIVIFDIMRLEEESLLENDFSKRRDILEKTINVKKNEIELSEKITTEDLDEANKFYQKSLLLGNEGIMMKSLSKGYKPGARIGYAVKVKPVLEPLDLVITKAEWGRGKRTGWVTSFTVSCRDEDNNLMEMGKVGTGVKELENPDSKEEFLTFKRFTDILTPLIIKEDGPTITVKPEIVVEVDYEEIQKSTNYGSGYALRFPRIKRIREDLKEPCSIRDVERIYREQRGRG